MERINIQLRGDGGLFGSASFPILDYRSLSGPGLGTFDALNSPLNNLDIDRIEVVRGPGSALYGPGVTSGVVHFITKSPIDKPGTAIELLGGELNTFGITARHATKVSDKFGFKVNAVLKRGDEFSLDPNDPDDAAQIALFQKTVSAPAITDGIVDATQPKGIRGNLSIQYDESFMALLGQFSGDTGNRTVVDLGLGYKFNDIITFDISAQNLLDNEYRAYPLFPEIGRRVLAKLTFNFAGKE